MIRRSIVLAASAAVLSAPAVAQNARNLWPDARHALNLDYEQRAKALQQEFADVKQADGGVLTPAHLSLLQEKLDDLLASYRRDLDGIDPLSVNAEGTPRQMPH